LICSYFVHFCVLVHEILSLWFSFL
jgi:hypothetical protein